jgi:hypothetical protein
MAGTGLGPGPLVGFGITSGELLGSATEIQLSSFFNLI